MDAKSRTFSTFSSIQPEARVCGGLVIYKETEVVIFSG
jgi:hypothetical protein